VFVNVFDFNFFFPIGHNLPITDRKGMANALRTNHFLSVNELSSQTRIQQMRSPISISSFDIFQEGFVQRIFTASFGQQTLKT